MNFGSSTPKTAASGFTLPAIPITSSSTGFQITGSGDDKLQNKPSTGAFGSSLPSGTINFGLNQPKTTAPTLNFGAPTATTPSLVLGAPSTVASSTAAPQFGFEAPKPTSTIAFTPILGTSTAVTTTGIPLGTSATTTAAAAPKLTFGLSTPATSAPVTSIGLSTSTAVAPTSLTLTTPSLPPIGSLTFSQLEDSINKWTIDLEEQGKFFINQAKQLNAWDSLLISNGEKILNLNGSIERVKQQQQQLDQELDFVLAQQKELEELIRPLEKELVEIPVTDIDRNQMYQFSEIIDSQLKQMSDDLKEIIEHINESNKDEEISNPVTQISRILNAHMNSLQWIDRNSAQISGHLEQITKMQDSNRRNFALTHSLNQSLSM